MTNKEAIEELTNTLAERGVITTKEKQRVLKYLRTEWVDGRDP